MNSRTASVSANQRFTPFTDSKIVLAYLEPILERLRQFFVYACARAADHFADRGWTPDPNLFAYEVRKDVFERLKALGADVTETEDPVNAPFSLERMALSGLLLKLPTIHLRIRKSSDSEMPASGSDQLLAFYNWNLFAFDDFETGADDPVPLHLVLLWNVDTNWRIRNFWLVCPRGERGGEVRSYWQEGIPFPELESDDRGQEFRSAFQEANSDVPLSPKDRNAKRRSEISTGTDKKKQ